MIEIVEDQSTNLWTSCSWHSLTCLPCSQTYFSSSYTSPSLPKQVKKPLKHNTQVKGHHKDTTLHANRRTRFSFEQHFSGDTIPMQRVVRVLEPEVHCGVQFFTNPLSKLLQLHCRHGSFKENQEDVCDEGMMFFCLTKQYLTKHSGFEVFWVKWQTI